MLHLHFPATPSAWPASWRRWLLAPLLAVVAAAGCASLPDNVQRTPSQAFASPEQTGLGRMVAERRQQDRARSDSGFVLLDGVDSAFAARLALADAAEKTLDLQYYAVHADATTELLLQRIKQAAARGVRVRILLDDFNTVGKDAQVLRLAFERNVEIRLFNPLPGSRASLVGRLVTSIKDVGRIQKRMHNKLFVADSAIGITGGRNLGDAYFGGDGKSSFVDLDVMAGGRIVRDMAASFDRYWNDDLAYPMKSLVSAEDLEKLRKPPEPANDPLRAPTGSTAVAAVSAASAPPPPAPGAVLPNVKPAEVSEAQPVPLDLRTVRWAWAPAVLLSDHPDKIGPGDDEVAAGETVVDGLLHLMSQARQDVLIVSPYFVPGPLMMEQFRALRQRGVRVRVLTNSLASNDAPAAHAGYARYRKDLLALGVELHEMRAGQGQSGGWGIGSSRSGNDGGKGVAGSKVNTGRASLHSKAVIIDGRTVVIGSMNLDLRSQRKNSEVALLVRSAALASAAAQRIEAMIAHGAYRLERQGDRYVWHAPQGAGFKDERDEPEASAKLKLLVRVIGPLAPDEML